MRSFKERGGGARPAQSRARLGVELLEGRLTPSWAGVPPSLLAPSNPAVVALNSSGYATGSAAITSGEVDWYAFTVKAGTYMFKARPMDPSPGEPRPNHRMLAAVLPTPQGNYFIRLVGPDKTVSAAKKDFVAWLKAFK